MTLSKSQKDARPVKRNILNQLLALGLLSTLTSSQGFAQDSIPTPVKVAPLSAISITVERSIPATAVSLRTATVASQIAAQVTEMSLIPGNIIKKGDVIARLDCSDYQLALESANSQTEALSARKTLASQQLARLNKLSQNLSASEEQINQRQAELAIVNAELITQSVAIKSAEQQVRRCRIKAPFSGLVTDNPGGVGNYLAPGQPVISLIDIDQIELKAALLEPQVNELKTHAPTFAFNGKKWPLTVRTIFPILDEATQTREIRFSFTDVKPAPGSIGRLHWTLTGNTIPATYLVARDGQSGIFVVDTINATEAKFLPIEGASSGQPINVKLPDDLLVVTDGRFGLNHVQAISIAPIEQ